MSNNYTFSELLSMRILSNIKFTFIDNHRDYIFNGKSDQSNIDTQIINRVDYPNYKKIINLYNNMIYDADYLYSRLNNYQSKDCLLIISTYLCLGHRHVRLPAWHPSIFDRISDIHQLCLSNNSNFYNFSNIGFPINCKTSKEILYSFAFDQPYCYKYGDINIDIEPNDIILDCGGGDGLTSLIFSHKSNCGKVFCFEPVQHLIKSINMNFLLNNNAITDNISIIPYAVWNIDDKELSYNIENRSTSLLANIGVNSVKTITIDTFIKNNKLNKVDFLKFDIEGAEIYALQGCIQTLKKYRPKLAISIYHPDSTGRCIDYYRIPKFIDSLRLGYKFYLKHHGFNRCETILYGIASN
jgi:FkbM family methyltransferase